LQEWIGENTVNVLQNFDIKEEKYKSVIAVGQSKGLGRKENQKLNKSDHCGQKVISVAKYDASLPLKSQGEVKVQASLKMDMDTSDCIEYVDLECSFQKDTR
jgi:hypothetical protein